MSQHIRSWIEAGYTAFALNGPDAIKVEALSRAVGKAKSSFYHHFADQEIFIESLLAYHIERAHMVALSSEVSESIEDDFLNVLYTHKFDLLFNRQLRMHRHNLSFQLCFEHAHRLVREQILPLYAEYIGYPENPDMAANLFEVMSDLFYSRVTEELFNEEFMLQFIREFKGLIAQIVASSGTTVQHKKQIIPIKEQ